MINVDFNPPMEAIRRIQATGDLFFKTIGNSGLDLSKYVPSNKFDYLLIKDTLFRKDVMLFSYRHFSNRVIETHICVTPEFRKTQLFLECVSIFATYMLNKGYKYIITTCPKNCSTVSFLKRMKFKECGIIPEGVFYNNELTDLILYQRELNNGNG